MEKKFYNNLLDIDAAINLINDCKEPTFAILNKQCLWNCLDNNVYKAWKKALAGDPISAFGDFNYKSRIKF